MEGKGRAKGRKEGSVAEEERASGLIRPLALRISRGPRSPTAHQPIESSVFTQSRRGNAALT